MKSLPIGSYYFLETFESQLIGTKWIQSKVRKENFDGRWSIESSIDSIIEEDKGLVLKSKDKHHAISAKVLKPFEFSKENLFIIQ